MVRRTPPSLTGNGKRKLPAWVTPVFGAYLLFALSVFVAEWTELWDLPSLGSAAGVVESLVVVLAFLVGQKTLEKLARGTLLDWLRTRAGRAVALVPPLAATVVILVLVSQRREILFHCDPPDAMLLLDGEDEPHGCGHSVWVSLGTEVSARLRDG